MSAKSTLDQIRASGIIAIIRATSRETAARQAEAVLAAGQPVVEVSLTTPGALDVIERLAASQDAVVGAGTVLDRQAAEDVIARGGRVLVCPTLDASVIEAAVRHDVAVVPGCLTPTEMVTAMALGATAVKVFPAHVWSPEGIAGLLQALPDLPCVPTGGVSPDNAADWIAAGAVAVGVGSALTAEADPAPLLTTMQARIAQARRKAG